MKTLNYYTSVHELLSTFLFTLTFGSFMLGTIESNVIGYFSYMYRYTVHSQRNVSSTFDPGVREQAVPD